MTQVTLLVIAILLGVLIWPSIASRVPSLPGFKRRRRRRRSYYRD